MDRKKIFAVSIILSVLLISVFANVDATLPAPPAPPPAATGGLCDSCPPACSAGLECKDGKCRYPCTGICIENPLKACNIQDLIDTVLNFVLYIVLALVPLIVIVAAFYFMTAAGNASQLNKAKDILLYAVIGLAIVLLAKGIVSVVKVILGG